jgi:hypothetical protein
MPKEDYLLKYLEKLSRVIAAMLGFRDKGFPEDAIRLANETFKELLSMDLDAISIMPVGKFAEHVSNSSFTSTYLEALAKLCVETAECYKSTTDFEKMRLFSEKALLLYLLLNEKDKTFSFDREKIISNLKLLVSDF